MAVCREASCNDGAAAFDFGPDDIVDGDIWGAVRCQRESSEARRTEYKGRHLLENSSSVTGFPAPARLSLYPKYNRTAVATTQLRCLVREFLYYRNRACLQEPHPENTDDKELLAAVDV
jgi:hypothetical protein